MWEAVGVSTLKEMRAYPAEKFQEVLMKYMQQQKSFGLPYSPCIDGELLTAPLDETARNGQELDIPYLIGYTSEDMMPEVMKKAATDWSLLLEQQGRKPAYVYCFSRDLPGEDMPSSQGAFGDMKGAFHSSELWYNELSERMVSYWTNFAKTGNPNGEGLPQWEPCTKANPHIQTLDIK